MSDNKDDKPFRRLHSSGAAWPSWEELDQEESLLNALWGCMRIGVECRILDTDDIGRIADMTHEDADAYLMAKPGLVDAVMAAFDARSDS